MINTSYLSYILLLFSYSIGGVFYYAFNINFVDELLLIIITVLYVLCTLKTNKVNRGLRYYVLLVLFFLFYSICLGITHLRAILVDIVQQSKPYVTFLCIYALHPTLKTNQKEILNKCSLFLSLLCFIIFVGGTRAQFFPFLAYYGNIMMLSALLYIYTSKRRKKDFICFLAILVAGLLSARSKYYGEFILVLFFMYYIKANLKFSIKNVFIGLFITSLILFFAWEKFNYYYVSGFEEDDIARPLLYRTSILLFSDYFPFGSGLGTFASDASKVYYSRLYYEYNLDRVWGLSKEFGEFIGDTYYPTIIGQFGLLGIVGFVAFFRFLFRETAKYFICIKMKMDYVIGVSILFIFIIESTSGATFISNLSIPYMILLAIIISSMRHKTLTYNK